jgi:hypothetical protein
MTTEAVAEEHGGSYLRPVQIHTILTLFDTVRYYLTPLCHIFHFVRPPLLNGSDENLATGTWELAGKEEDAAVRY